MRFSHRKGHYNNNNRKLKLKSLCYDCGESGSNNSVFGLEELQEKRLSDSDEHKCYPICADRTTGGKDVVKHGKQDKMQARKEKEDRAAKVKTAKEKSKDTQRNKNSAASGVTYK